MITTRCVRIHEASTILTAAALALLLSGLYGRMNHYGWDSKRGILLALGNNTA